MNFHITNAINASAGLSEEQVLSLIQQNQMTNISEAVKDVIDTNDTVKNSISSVATTATNNALNSDEVKSSIADVATTATKTAIANDTEVQSAIGTVATTATKNAITNDTDVQSAIGTVATEATKTAITTDADVQSAIETVVTEATKTAIATDTDVKETIVSTVQNTVDETVALTESVTVPQGDGTEATEIRLKEELDKSYDNVNSFDNNSLFPESGRKDVIYIDRSTGISYLYDDTTSAYIPLAGGSSDESESLSDEDILGLFN